MVILMMQIGNMLFPRPKPHIHGSIICGFEDFFSLVSSTAGGYCFYKDARLRRMTRYRYNSVPIDNGYRYFCINDDGDFWSPGWMPVRKDLNHY